MIDLLRERGGDEIKVFGGGGGVIAPEEIAELHEYGVTRIYSPEDGQRMGLQGMINDCGAPRRLRSALAACPTIRWRSPHGDRRVLARIITALENDVCPLRRSEPTASAAAGEAVPILGVTGTGGSGKSSLDRRTDPPVPPRLRG